MYLNLKFFLAEGNPCESRINIRYVRKIVDQVCQLIRVLSALVNTFVSGSYIFSGFRNHVRIYRSSTRHEIRMPGSFAASEFPGQP